VEGNGHGIIEAIFFCAAAGQIWPRLHDCWGFSYTRT